jgi:hypothetical protein
MDRPRVPHALALLLAASTHCAAYGAAEPAPEEPEAEVPLDLAIEAVDLSHGALRVIATMTDGAADVSVTLGGTCEPREVGAGWSTASAFVWTFREMDLADALGCGLVVRARARLGATKQTKVAQVAVGTSVVRAEEEEEAAAGSESEPADEQESSEEPAEGPDVQDVTITPDGMTLAFVRVARGARLSVGDDAIEAAECDPACEEEADPARRYDVPAIAFARSVLLRRPLVVDGAAFTASVDVGGVSLDRGQ